MVYYDYTMWIDYVVCVVCSDDIFLMEPVVAVFFVRVMHHKQTEWPNKFYNSPLSREIGGRGQGVPRNDFAVSKTVTKAADVRKQGWFPWIAHHTGSKQACKMGEQWTNPYMTQ